MFFYKILISIILVFNNMVAFTDFTLAKHGRTYQLSCQDKGISGVILLTASPYSFRHFDCAKEYKAGSFPNISHKVIAVVEAIPVVGALCGLIERIAHFVHQRFFPQPTDQSPAPNATSSDSKEASSTASNQSTEKSIEGSINDFSKKASEHLNTSINSDQRLNIVLGNEAADCDSIVSALLLSQFYSSQKREMFVPVINIPENELALRRDMVKLFQLLRIKPESLVWFEKGFLNKVNPNLNLILVDHNGLAPAESHLNSNVIEIIDHHDDENIKYTQTVSKNLNKVGSNTTLIVQKIKEAGYQLDTQWALMALMPILIDTENFKEEGDAQELDKDMANWLKEFINLDDLRELIEDYNKTSPEKIIIPNNAQSIEQIVKILYDKLADAKIDTKGFSAEERLLKDMKTYPMPGGVYSISSVNLSSKDFPEAFPNNLNPILISGNKSSEFPFTVFDIQEFIKKKGLEMAVILISVDKKEKYIAIDSNEETQASKLKIFLKGKNLAKGKTFENSVCDNPSNPCLIFEIDPKFKRKKLAPFIKDFFYPAQAPAS
jgi:inorganic pyrophosphatase/exopolyphosphatase